MGSTSVVVLAVVLLLSVHLTLNVEAASVVNRNVKRKRDAKAKAKAKFLEKHGIVFDSYGRVLRWGKQPTEYACKEKKGSYYCNVVSSEDRKYRTKEEDRRGKLIRLDKQAELDAMAGSTSVDAKAARRRRQEDRKRCSLYKEWMEEFNKDGETGKKQFFGWLGSNFVGFGELRSLAQSSSRSAKRKSKKLYRNIAREIHSDKLPEGCRDSEFKGMMSTILGKVEQIRDCIQEPHTCDPSEL